MLTFKKHVIFSAIATAGAAVTVLAAPGSALAAAARADLRGKILLQVQQRGEAWYVRPSDGKRISMPTAAGAFSVMRSEGVGISENDIWKIPVGLRDMEGTDTDGDGLTDAFESAVGTDPTKADTDGDGFSDKQEISAGYNAFSKTDKKKVGDSTFVKKNLGKIFLQVEKKGEAWWVNPADGHRYFLGRPADAYALMRGFGLGITEADVNKIDKTEMTAEQSTAAKTDSKSETPKTEQPAETVAPKTEKPSVEDGGTDTSDSKEAVAPITGQASPVGSGYTMTASYTVSDPEKRAILWGDRFADESITGAVKVTRYVDDVGNETRMDASYGDNFFYSEFAFEVDGQGKQEICEYPGGKTTQPECRTSTVTGIPTYTPSNTDKASVKFADFTRLPNRTVAGLETSCYALSGESACYYDDSSSVVMYELSDSLRFEAESFVVGRPDASLFVKPAAVAAASTK